MGLKRFNFNNYEKCKKEEATHEIVLFKLEDGTTPPPIYLKSKRKPKPKVTLKSIRAKTATWEPTIHVDIKGSPAEYQEIVNWWFDCAYEDETFRNTIKATFANLKNRTQHVENAKGWLLTKGAFELDGTGDFKCRIKDIRAFLVRWMTKQLKQQR